MGVIFMQFKNKKLSKNHLIQYELEKSKAELEKQQQQINNHFMRTSELLENISHEYCQLYKHIAESSESLFNNNFEKKKNPFIDNKNETPSGKIELEIPSDYPRRSSNLIKNNTKK